MTEQEAREIAKNTMVMWDNDPADVGKIIEKGLGGFFVRWKNGQEGWIAFKDTGRVSRVEQVSG